MHDPYVWAYTQEFAERFQMPKEWIDTNLKGMYAVAFRMTAIGTMTCGLGKNEQSCWPPMDCQMDIYFDSNAPLPWVRDDIRQDHFQRGLYSTDYLYYPGNNRYQRYPREIAGYGPLYSGGAILVGDNQPGEAVIKNYDRDFQEGISFVSYVGSGVCPRHVGVGKMHFYDKQTIIKLRRGLVKQSEAGSVRVFEFPAGFMKRANMVYERANEHNVNVSKELLKQFFDSRKQSSE